MARGRLGAEAHERGSACERGCHRAKGRCATLGYKVVPAPSVAPEQWDITGQVSVSVTPTDHFGAGSGAGTGGGGGPVDPPPQNPDAVLTAIAALRENLRGDMASAVAPLAAGIAAARSDIDTVRTEARDRVYLIDASAKIIGGVSGTIAPRK